MTCNSLHPDFTARDQAKYLNEHMPAGLFRGVGVEETAVAWRLSPEPFSLSPKTLAAIEALGPVLLTFYRALNNLYLRSARGTAPAFVADYLDQGKPEAVIKLARQNRFKNDVPHVIRPDLILTENGMIAVELDSVPGGMGFVAAMAQTYCELGFETIGTTDGIALGFSKALAAACGCEPPTVGIVVSEESKDYRPELNYLASRVNAMGIAQTYVVTPGDVVFTEDALFVRLSDGREEKIDVLYRNFELFDLFNVPKWELMMYAARHNRVRITASPKAHLEEKMSAALLHHPELAHWWKTELGEAGYALLQKTFPKTWIVDPRPVPPQAGITGLTAAGLPVRDFMQFGSLPKSERDWVIKPSGFSEFAWGSKGVKVANDLSREEWTAAIRAALDMYPKTPHILQRFHKGKRVTVPYYDPKTDETKVLEGRVRLCPYYFVTGDETQLGGILATIAPSDKRLIHGMADAVMSPCAVNEGGY